jgi:hypothetical protein
MLFIVRQSSHIYIIIYYIYLQNFFSCSENTKNVLLSCSFLHLEKKEFIKQFSEISSINQRILLSGPAGKLCLVSVVCVK